MGFRLADWIYKLSRKIAFGVFGIICLYLFLLSIFSTCVIWYDTESTFYIKDFPLLLMAGLAGLTGMVFLCRRLLEKIVDRRMAVMGMATLVWAALAFVFIINTKIELVYDQQMVYQAVIKLLEGDYSPWQPGGYMHAYPFQNGLVLLYIPLRIIFRDNIYMAVQVINLLFMELLAVGFYKLGERYFGINVAVFSYLGTLSFFPMWGYLKYMYGNLPGLCLAVWAVYFLTKYLENGKRRYAGASAGCILFAVAYKGNFLVYAIAMCIVLLVECIVRKKGAYLCVTALLAVAVMLGANGASWIMRGVTGYETNRGIPKTHWITMGLRESYVAPGWYSGDSRKWFEENDFSIETCIKDDMEQIAGSVQRFWNDKEYGRDFFAKKIASSWNNPTFEGFAIVVKGNLKGTLDYWMKDILYSGGVMNTILTVVMDIIQSIYLFGALLYMMYCRKERELNKAIPLVALTGGFLMHIFWEAKCQYTIIYFIVLIPYAFAGYQECARRLGGVLSDIAARKKVLKNEGVWKFAVLLGVILALFLCNGDFVMSTFKLKGGGGDYIWMCREWDYWKSDSFTKEGPREE